MQSPLQGTLEALAAYEQQEVIWPDDLVATMKKRPLTANDDDDASQPSTSALDWDVCTEGALLDVCSSPVSELTVSQPSCSGAPSAETVVTDDEQATPHESTVDHRVHFVYGNPAAHMLVMRHPVDLREDVQFHASEWRHNPYQRTAGSDTVVHIFFVENVPMMLANDAEHQARALGVLTSMMQERTGLSNIVALKLESSGSHGGHQYFLHAQIPSTVNPQDIIHRVNNQVLFDHGGYWTVRNEGFHRTLLQEYAMIVRHRFGQTQRHEILKGLPGAPLLFLEPRAKSVRQLNQLFSTQRHRPNVS